MHYHNFNGGYKSKACESTACGNADEKATTNLKHIITCKYAKTDVRITCI